MYIYIYIYIAVNQPLSYYRYASFSSKSKIVQTGIHIRTNGRKNDTQTCVRSVDTGEIQPYRELLRSEYSASPPSVQKRALATYAHAHLICIRHTTRPRLQKSKKRNAYDCNVNYNLHTALD